MGQIIRSVPSVSVFLWDHIYGSNFQLIFMDVCTAIWGLKTKIKLLGVKIRWCLPVFCPNFSPHDAFLMGRFENRGNEARRPTDALCWTCYSPLFPQNPKLTSVAFSVKIAWLNFDTEYLSNHARWRVGSSGPLIVNHNRHVTDDVTWPQKRW